MKSINFEIADRFISVAEEDSYTDVPSCAPYVFDSAVEGDAYFLEDLLQLVAFQDDLDVDDALGFDNDEDLLIWALSYLSETSLGRAMAHDARFDGWALEVDDLDNGLPLVDSQLRILILPRGTPSLSILSQTPYYRHQFLLNLARGLRLIWQDMQGVRERFDISLDDQILLERLRKADQDIIMVRMMWDLRTVDDGTLWRHLITEDMDDLVTLAAGMWSTEGEDAEDVPNALLKLFQCYMASDDILNRLDGMTLDAMDARLLRGTSGFCGHNTLKSQDILALGRLPEGGSYLAPLCRTLLYAEDMRRMADPILETHLRQIITDGGFALAAPLVFHDAALQEKIFPQHRLDTLA